MSRFGTIIQIGDILVSEDVVLEYFACDYAACKGCCCVIGDSGAPLEEDEPEALERFFPAYSPLMGEAGRAAALSSGFFEVDRDGDLVTPVIRANTASSTPQDSPVSEPCAYTGFDADGSCFCTIERTCLAGRCPWRKPISCQLYPIRVTKLTGGGKALNLHRWHICRDAFEKGRREGIRVYQFLREPLTAAFGADFYDALCAAASHLLSSRK